MEKLFEGNHTSLDLYFPRARTYGKISPQSTKNARGNITSSDGRGGMDLRLERQSFSVSTRSELAE